MKHGNSRPFFFRQCIALVFLTLFIGGFTAEAMAFNWGEACQSELVDGENEKDSEEDSEKEKEDKIVETLHLLAYIDQISLNNHSFIPDTHNEEINEVLSPPPDFVK